MRTLTKLISYPLLVSKDHQLTSWLFLKLLAIIYFSSFLSIAVQITGLVGQDGILPLNEYLEYLYQQNGYTGFLYRPSLFWINSGDLALQIVAYGGCLLSVALLFGYRKKYVLTLLFIFYLSIFHAGQVFLSFQWDTLLLEAGFLAIFLAAGPSHLVIFLYHWLLFRLRFMSGVSKLVSDDPVWANLTTLKYYFETQPLPHAGAWYFHQLPEVILKAGTVFVFFTELIVPFFIFLPRKFRLFAAAITIFMQLLIIATSNHNWINILTIILCLFLLDDKIVKKIIPEQLLPSCIGTSDNESFHSTRKYILPLAAILIIGSSSLLFLQSSLEKRLSDLIIQSTAFVRAWGVGHTFHVFPTMQTERHELQVEGSYDGIEWQAYQFKYKPGPLNKKPEFIIPHQPRLDWMIWFVPPQHTRFNYWFGQFIIKLKQGAPDVLDTAEERQVTGRWWKYHYLGLFPDVKPRRP